MGNYRPMCDLWLLTRPKVKYYGAYPSGFLERARRLLGVHRRDSVLHVCGGRAKDYPRWSDLCPFDYTLDLDPRIGADFIGNVGDGLPGVPARRNAPPVVEFGGQFQPWPAILADPPYTREDAAQYAPGAGHWPTPRVVLTRMLEAVRPGGRVGLLHYVVPRPPTDVRLVAVVAVVVGFDNRGRLFSVYETRDTGSI